MFWEAYIRNPQTMLTFSELASMRRAERLSSMTFGQSPRFLCANARFVYSAAGAVSGQEELHEVQASDEALVAVPTRSSTCEAERPPGTGFSVSASVYLCSRSGQSH